MKWVPLLEMAGKHIFRDDARPTAYNRICLECLNAMVKSYIIKTTMLMMSFVPALSAIVLAYFRDGLLVTLYEVRIPFLQDDPQTEYIINMSWQGFVSINGIPAVLLLESFPAIVNSTITTTSKLTVQKLNELSDDLETESIGMKEVNQKMRNIIMQVLYMEK